MLSSSDMSEGKERLGLPWSGPEKPKFEGAVALVINVLLGVNAWKK